jgi:hypothetical protein
MIDLLPRLVETSRRLHLEVLELRRIGDHDLAAALTRAGHAIMRLIGEIATHGEEASS